ncbi:MAG: stage V sporulation protein AC [Oscillospiraceae bacterium]|nr:stage V sporulation protein AC [Oscillospiraceae bacterium]
MFDKMSKEEYEKYVQKQTPNSPVLKNCVFAFLIGGLICAAGQFLLTMYKKLDISEELAATAVSVTLIFISTMLTGFDLYERIAKFAGAGTIVPITGFANSVASPALEAKSEGFVLGVGAKLFTIAGPVILYGTIASFIAGIVYFFIK